MHRITLDRSRPSTLRCQKYPVYAECLPTLPPQFQILVYFALRPANFTDAKLSKIGNTRKDLTMKLNIKLQKVRVYIE